MQPKRQVLLQAAVCVAVGLVLCVAGVVADEVTIIGTVLTPDGQPAAGARMIGAWRSFDDSRRYVWAETTSDTAGAFWLHLDCEGAPYTEGTVTALKDGFGMGCELIDISRTGNCVVRLSANARLRGTVADSTGRPVAGARVELVSACVWPDAAPIRFAGQVAVLSAEDGQFSLDGLAGGCGYGVEVHCDGWTTVVADVPALGDSEMLNVVLRPEAVVCGFVTQGGKPVGGVPVGAERTDAPASTDDPGCMGVPLRVDTVTDADGFYILEGLSAGVYNVCAGADDGCDLTAVAHEGLNCPPGQRLEHRDFELTNGVLITGRVISTTRREPAPGVVMHCQGPARPASGTWTQSTRTDEDGSYRFCVPPGVNAVWLERPLLGGTTQPHQMVITEGRTAGRGEYTVTASCPIDALVVDQDGNPLSNGTVEFQSCRGNGTDIRQCKLNRHGRLRITMDKQFMPQELLVRDAEGARAGLVGLTEGAERLQVQMHPPCTLTGTVVAPSGEPLAGIDVSCQHEVIGEPQIYQRRLGQVSTTDEHGRFRIEGLTASTTVWVMIEGDARRYQLSSDWRKLVLQPSETRDVGTAVVNLSGLTLRGRTMDAERNLLPNCTVIDIQSHSRTRSDAHGVFELSGLPHRDWPPYLLAVDPQTSLFGVEARVDPGCNMAVNMVLEPLASARGRLLTADGKPLTGATVSLFISNRPRCVNPAVREGAILGAHLDARVTTGADGAWQCSGLVCGTEYRIEARQGFGWPQWAETFIPVPGNTVDFGDVTVK